MIWKFILNSLPPLSPSNFIQISLAVVPDQSVHNIRGHFGLLLSNHWLHKSVQVILQQLNTFWIMSGMNIREAYPSKLLSTRR